MSGRGFRPSERITRATLNRALTAPVDLNLSGPRVNERRGQTVITDEEEIYVRVTGSATSPRRYAWQEVYHDKVAGGWKSTNRMGSVDSDPAFELNDAIVPSGLTVYTARRSRASGAWTFNKGGGGGGNVEIKSGDTMLMLLGTYEQYKDCPDVPPSPPTLTTGCGEATTTLCVPAYAYAVYVRCGYLWNKIGDTRTFGVWANEDNGGTASAFRRFVRPRWGGDRDPITWLPDPDSDCMGVTFKNADGGSLTCSCPDWAIEQCIKVTYTIIDRPFPTGNGGYTDCNDVFLKFDIGDAEGPYWGRTFTALINQGLSLCNSGSDTEGPLTFNIEYRDTEPGDCFWGPAVFDPCRPCDAFGRFYIRGEIVGVEERPNCGGTAHFDGYLTIEDIRSVICDCETITLKDLEACQGCDGNVGLPPMVFVDLETIEVTCCPSGEPEGVGAVLARSVSSAHAVTVASPTTLPVVSGSFADASIPDATAATPNAGAITAGSTTAAYAVKLGVATAGAIVVGSVSALSPTDVYYIDSFEDL